jgi:Zn-dependent peptidase ImmA (M78 family)
MTYENLLLEAEKEGLEVYEHKFATARLKGLCVNNVITLNSSSVETNAEKLCILAEELGHYHTTHGNILDQNNTTNRKQERRARAWAYERFVSLKRLIEASNQGIKNRYELAEFLGVSEGFIKEAIQYYKEKYGICYKMDDYIIYFEPLGVLKKKF